MCSQRYKKRVTACIVTGALATMCAPAMQGPAGYSEFYLTQHREV